MTNSTRNNQNNPCDKLKIAPLKNSFPILPTEDDKTKFLRKLIDSTSANDRSAVSIVKKIKTPFTPPTQPERSLFVTKRFSPPLILKKTKDKKIWTNTEIKTKRKTPTRAIAKVWYRASPITPPIDKTFPLLAKKRRMFFINCGKPKVDIASISKALFWCSSVKFCWPKKPPLTKSRNSCLKSPICKTRFFKGRNTKEKIIIVTTNEIKLFTLDFKLLKKDFAKPVETKNKKR